MQAREILETSLYADDLAQAERFYTAVLGLRVVTRVPDRHVFFRCGGRMLLVFRASATEQGGVVPAHGTRGAGHAAFAAAHDELAGWRAHLERCGVAVEHEHAWPGGGHSLYFRDPAGNSLEIATPVLWGIDDAEAFGLRRQGDTPGATGA
jgi:catechol 2,3-dioxygenase-like lactoylglutathione lyase family enzyme